MGAEYAGGRGCRAGGVLLRICAPGGELLLGWNDISPRNRVVPEDIPALRRFEAGHFGDSANRRGWKMDAANRHVFDFYRRPIALTISK